MSIATDVRYTPEDLLAMPDGHRFELIDGQLVERNMGAESSWIAQTVNRKIGNHVESAKSGLVFAPDCGYRIFPDDPKRVRFPDGSFIAAGRLPNDEPPKGHVRIAPDLVVEVVSPNDKAWELEQKVDDFLRAGVRMMWVFYPDLRSVLVYRGSNEVKRLREDDQLSGADVLAGFACPVGDCFPARSKSAAE